MPSSTHLRRLLALSLLALLAIPESAVGAETPAWRWPVTSPPTVLRQFVAPLARYGPGHRGVDLGLPISAKILAPAPGTVVFNGIVARIPTLVLDHGGGLRSTYQPVISTLKVGQTVAVGAAIGSLVATGGHCAPKSCLHWGARNSAGYLDPVRLVRRTMPVLLPLQMRVLSYL
jgi:murein DD-endopeptidase MepM/ murein hydrolase activator NlpD